MDNLAFDIHSPHGARFEVTEDYEGDKYHVVVFVDGEHTDTQGFNTGNELLEYIRRAGC